MGNDIFHHNWYKTMAFKGKKIKTFEKKFNSIQQRKTYKRLSKAFEMKRKHFFLLDFLNFLILCVHFGSLKRMGKS